MIQKGKKSITIQENLLLISTDVTLLQMVLDGCEQPGAFPDGLGQLWII